MLVYFILFFGMIGPLLAQEEDRPQVINAGNIERLGSVGRIEFDPQQTDQGVIYQNGRFALRTDGERIALSDIQGNISILNAHGLLVDSYGVAGADGLIANPQAITFGSNEQVASIHTDGESFYLAQLDYHSGEYQVLASDRPLFDLWFTDSAIYVEAEDYVGVLEKGNVTFLSDGFHADTESIIRIGRIEPPLAVTVTEDGRVKRWNMETGEVTAEVRVEGALPIYGQLNAGGDRYLVLRDPQSLALHV
ncbi:MAG: hypothetical protein K8L99_31770, partial [Anaerolineae bacterium]|nr:hypothetical protein [Anaerolineae bacterium]